MSKTSLINQTKDTEYQINLAELNSTFSKTKDAHIIPVNKVPESTAKNETSKAEHHSTFLTKEVPGLISSKTISERTSENHATTIEKSTNKNRSQISLTHNTELERKKESRIRKLIRRFSKSETVEQKREILQANTSTNTDFNNSNQKSNIVFRNQNQENNKDESNYTGFSSTSNKMKDAHFISLNKLSESTSSKPELPNFKDSKSVPTQTPVAPNKDGKKESKVRKLFCWFSKKTDTVEENKDEENLKTFQFYSSKLKPLEIPSAESLLANEKPEVILKNQIKVIENAENLQVTEKPKQIQENVDARNLQVSEKPKGILKNQIQDKEDAFVLPSPYLIPFMLTSTIKRDFLKQNRTFPTRESTSGKRPYSVYPNLPKSTAGYGNALPCNCLLSSRKHSITSIQNLTEDINKSSTSGLNDSRITLKSVSSSGKQAKKKKSKSNVKNKK